MIISLKWNMAFEFNVKKKSKKWQMSNKNKEVNNPPASQLSSHLQQDIGVLESISNRRVHMDYI